MAAQISRRARSGATLVELMVTVAVISVAGVGLAGSFVYISRALQLHRMKTLAANLSQEQVEVLKAKPYYAIAPTPAPGYNTAFSPPLRYDQTFYPPQTITIGAASFVRLTYVERVFNNAGTLVPAPSDGLDTGLKRITVHTLWRAGWKWRKYTLTNLAGNNAAPPTGGFAGTVNDIYGNPVAGAQVATVEDAALRAYSDGSGLYGFAVAPGTYTPVAAAPGYFTQISTTSYEVSPGDVETASFSLVPMSSGTVYGSAYLDTHLLVSEVAASTQTEASDLSTHDIEYVELFNPTTFAVDVGSAFSQALRLDYRGQNGVDDALDIPLVYVSTYVAPAGCYLIASAPSFVIAGAWRTADAYYQTLYADAIKKQKAGAVLISDPAGAVIDGVGWTNSASGAGAPWSKGAPVTQAQGLGAGDELVRMSSAGAVNGAYGRAYDAGDNAESFAYNGSALMPAGGVPYPPCSASSGARTVAAGAPAYGALVSADDGLSASTAAWQAWSSGSPYAAFALPGVATGTWRVAIASAGASLALASVSVSSRGAWVAVPNAGTAPAWPAAGVAAAILSSSTGQGFVTGRVSDASGAPLAGVSVDVEPAASGQTNAQGFYAVQAPAGVYTVVANAGSASAPNYGSASLTGVAVPAGGLAGGRDMTLSGAGGVAGYICDFSTANPYPGVTVTAADSLGGVWGQAVTGLDGRFLIQDLSTGTYTVAPALDVEQAASPAGAPVVVALGQTVFAGTFTVTGAYGVISGSVAAAGLPITTGVLLVATTGSLAAPLPPDISSAALAGAPYYMTSSLSDGSFRLRVRASTASAHFNLYGWYTTYSGGAPDPPSKKSRSVSVTGGQTALTGLQW